MRFCGRRFGNLSECSFIFVSPGCDPFCPLDGAVRSLHCYTIPKLRFTSPNRQLKQCRRGFLRCFLNWTESKDLDASCFSTSTFPPSSCFTFCSGGFHLENITSQFSAAQGLCPPSFYVTEGMSCHYKNQANLEMCVALEVRTDSGELRNPLVYDTPVDLLQTVRANSLHLARLGHFSGTAD